MGLASTAAPRRRTGPAPAKPAWSTPLWVVCALWAVLALTALPARAAEEIVFYDTDLVLRADGSLIVTETITLIAEGDRIRRGIYRDIAADYVRPNGTSVPAQIEVLSVLRDGAPDLLRLEPLPGGTRIRIGRDDVFLTHGKHTYTLHYAIANLAQRRPDQDELYWTATGYWPFPILAARAVVTVPEGAIIRDLVGYTGAPGSLEQMVEVSRLSDTQARFAASRRLEPGEGLSLLLAFTSGTLAPQVPPNLVAGLGGTGPSP